VDAVSTFGDIEDPWYVHCEKLPFGGESIRAQLTTYIQKISRYGRFIDV